jgi:hypothetical protein
LPQLDPGIASYVDVLRANCVNTIESCQGGDGHSYAEPTVRFSGQPDEGLRALAIALMYHWPVARLDRSWSVIDHELIGPDWRLVFWATCPDG